MKEFLFRLLDCASIYPQKSSLKLTPLTTKQKIERNYNFGKSFKTYLNWRERERERGSSGVRGVWVQLLEGQGAGARVILVLRECIWSAPVALLVLPALILKYKTGFLPSVFSTF